MIAKKMPARLAVNTICKGLFFLATLVGLLVLAILFYRIFTQGIGSLNGDFLQNFASRKPEEAGIKAALIGSIWLMVVVAPFSLLLGVGTAIYLEEYARKNWITTFIKVNISNLAGVPSIVFGLLGLTVFRSCSSFGPVHIGSGLDDEPTCSSCHHSSCPRGHTCRTS